MATLGLSIDAGKFVAVGLFALLLWNPWSWHILLALSAAGAATIVWTVGRHEHGESSKLPVGTDIQDEKGSANAGFNPDMGDAGKEPLGVWLASALLTSTFLLFSFWPVAAADGNLAMYGIIIGGQAVSAVIGNIVLSKLKRIFFATVLIGIAAGIVGSGLLWTPLWAVGALMWGFGCGASRQQWNTKNFGHWLPYPNDENTQVASSTLYGSPEARSGRLRLAHWWLQKA